MRSDYGGFGRERRSVSGAVDSKDVSVLRAPSLRKVSSRYQVYELVMHKCPSLGEKTSFSGGL